MAPKLPLPRGWKRRVRSSVLHIVTTVRFGCMPRSTAGTTKIALLQEELRIQNARMDRVPPHPRPHYTPLERMSILELRAARAWSARQAAERFHVTPTTLGSWKARIDEYGPNAMQMASRARVTQYTLS